MSDKARLEVVKAHKPERQHGIPLPGADQTVVYEGAKRRLSVVETCNGGPGTTTALRIEVGTIEQVVTANRPNYRIAVDIPLDEALVGILALALDRAEENAHQHRITEAERRRLYEVDAAEILLQVDNRHISDTELTLFREFFPGPGFLMRDEEEAFRRFRANNERPCTPKEGGTRLRDANDHSSITAEDLTGFDALVEAEERRQRAGAEILPTEEVPGTDKEVVTPRAVLDDLPDGAETLEHRDPEDD